MVDTPNAQLYESENRGSSRLTILTRLVQSVNFIGQFSATHSSVAQWQSIRLLTEGL